MSDEEATNPYAIPVADVVSTPREVDFVEVIRWWEKGRLVYNGVLIFFTLMCTFAAGSRLIFDLRYWASVVLGAIGANLCYFAGPTIEGYGRYLRIWRPAFSKLLFAAGLAFATLLAVLCVVTW